MKKPKFKATFFQDWGTFSNETLVCVGVDKPEILRYMKLSGVKPDLIAAFTRKVDSPTASAFVWTPPMTGCTLLWLKRWTGNADDLDDLVHETNHLIYDIARDKGFQNEPEIQAYQQGYLFSGILKTLTERRAKFNGVKSKSKKRKTNGNKNS